MIDQLRTVAQSQEQPQQMNPETNLPYGARSILPRSYQQKAPVSTVQANDEDLARKLALLQGFSKASPSSQPAQRPSPPKQQQPQPRAPSRAEGSRQPSSPLSRGTLPSISQGYPYGGAGQYQGAGSNAPAMPSPPAASALPSNGFKPKARQNSTEQKSMLLSMFKDKSAEVASSSSSNNYAMGESARYSPRPRSRLASVTSNGDQDLGQAPARPIPSRQGSQTPISPANEKFLMNFLRGSSDKTTRNA